MNNEPVAWMDDYGCVVADNIKKLEAVGSWTFHSYTIPLYTAEQLHPAKTLTDEEIHKVDREVLNEFNGEDYVLRFARAIMKRCGIINGTDK
jgi:hypothetical protein